MIGNLLGWLIVLGIGVPFSIALHELGHLLPAKRFGVACPQYFIGFGPTIWSRRRGGTEYGIKAIPLGGYVRMIGMFPPAAAARAARSPVAVGGGRFGSLIEAARADAARDIRPGDEDRLFYQRSVPKRLTIMFGGPFMNLALAVVLLGGVITLYGTSTLTTTVHSVSQCVLPVSTQPGQTPRTTCTASDPAAPAAQAGFRPGDTIVAFGGVPVEDWTQVRDAIRANTGTPVEIEVERAGERVGLTATPMVDTRYVLDSDGNLVEGADGSYRTVRVGFLGITPADELVRQPITAVPGVVGGYLARVAGVLPQVPEKMVGVVKSTFGGGERDPNGPISVVGVGRLAGEVGSLQGTDGYQVSWSDKLVTWISLIASLNLALFVFNMIPLLPLTAATSSVRSGRGCGAGRRGCSGVPILGRWTSPGRCPWRMPWGRCWSRCPPCCCWPTSSTPSASAADPNPTHLMGTTSRRARQTGTTSRRARGGWG